MQTVFTLILTLTMIGAFGSTNAQADGSGKRAVYIRGERRLYPLLPPLRINKALAQMQKEDANGRSRFARMLDGAVPQKRDLLKYLTPIKDQGTRGTCAAFAGAALVETLVKVKLGKEVDLSEQYAYWASKALPGGAFPNSDGSTLTAILNAIAHYGIVSEQVLPYQPRGWFEDTVNHSDCVAAYKADPENVPTLCLTNGNAAQSVRSKAELPIESVQDTTTDSNTIIGFLSAGIPVEIGMSVYQKAWGFDNPKGAKFRAGVITMPTGDDVEVGGHAVLIVGYDLTTKTYLFKNSWGTNEWSSTSSHPGVGIVPMSYVRQYAVAATAKLVNHSLDW